MSRPLRYLQTTDSEREIEARSNRAVDRSKNVTIRPSVFIEPIYSGVAARLPEIGMACHGRDADRALASVRSTVAIWARALASDGTLKKTLARLGVVWEETRRGRLVVPTLAGVTSLG